MGRPTTTKIVYPKLYGVLPKRYGTFSAAAKRIGISRNALSCILRGQRMPTKFTIDCILAASGLTYEEAFKEEI